MYRLMIADDEDDERRGIQFLLERCGFAFEITEAVDGREALEKLQNTPVDILFTDVKMPFLTGIQLAAEARKLYPDLQLIFFSGYDDFEYVKQALSLQAVDYILKPVNPDEFSRVIGTVVERMRVEEKEDSSSRYVQKQYVLTRLLNQVPIEKLKREYDSGILEFAENQRRLILMEFDSEFFGKIVIDIRLFMTQLQTVIEDEFEFLDVSPSQGVIFLRDRYSDEKQCKELARCIHLLMVSQFGRNCYLAVSPLITDPDATGRIYAEAEASLEDRFFYRETYVYPMDGEKRQGQAAISDDHELLKQIERDIAGHDCYSLRLNMESFLEKCRENGYQSYIYTRFVCTNLLQILYKELPDGEAELAAVVEKSYACTTFAELEQLLWDVQKQLEDRMEQTQDSPKHTIALVEQYMKDHYDEGLSLDILAEKVYLTPHYLSSIFIQEKGIGINKYIKNMRMEKAKELLLNTNMKISDVCEKVGYTNLSYFCRSFRNEYGVTPEQFRH